MVAVYCILLLKTKYTIGIQIDSRKKYYFMIIDQL